MPSTESVSHHDLIVCACENQEYTAATTTDGPRFIALGSLDRYEISPRTGQVLPLRVGMKADGHINVGGRTVIEYAFEPIRQLRESMNQ
jgi:hypothetical protein